MSDNLKTILYAAAMTLIVALVLATLTSFLRPIQKVQEDRDKKISILKAVEYNEGMDPEAEYERRIQEVVVNSIGEVQEGEKAFDIDLYKEGKKAVEDRLFPLYIYTADTKKKKYIIPMNGMGLWDQISGFMALKEDFNTVDGAIFAHVGETPGLGAEITTDWFQTQFKNRKVKDETGNFALKVLKGMGNKLDDYSVDGITGSTITCDGVNAMMEEDIDGYTAYFKVKETEALTEGKDVTPKQFSSTVLSKARDFFKLGKSKIANHVYFDGRTSILNKTEQCMSQMMSLIAYLDKNPTKKIKLKVNDRKDEDLSKRRAKALYAYALQAGANDKQLSFEGTNDRSKADDTVEFELLN